MHTLRRASAARDNTSEYMYGKTLQAKCVRCARQLIGAAVSRTMTRQQEEAKCVEKVIQITVC